METPEETALRDKQMENTHYMMCDQDPMYKALFGSLGPPKRVRLDLDHRKDTVLVYPTQEEKVKEVNDFLKRIGLKK